MKLILTTSHNQFNQVKYLLEKAEDYFSFNFHLIVVESGNNSVYNFTNEQLNKTTVLNVSEGYFWSKSVSEGLKFIYDNYVIGSYDLIIMNCDVALSNWKVMNSINVSLFTFYTVSNGIVRRSGYCITNWFLAKHYYPKYQINYSESIGNVSVDIVPTRFIFISKENIQYIRNIFPKHKKLPHYAADFVFTLEISKKLKKKWTIISDAYLIEDVSLTGLKIVKGSLYYRLKLLTERKSVYNIKDKLYYALYVSKHSDKPRVFYLTSSLLKLIFQVFK